MHRRYAAAAILIFTITACQKKKPQTTPSPAPAATPEVAPQAPPAQDAEAERAARERERLDRIRATAASLTTTIQFEFDEYDLDAAARSVLDQKIQIMNGNSQVRIRATGHADDRGSDEYNLALGQRRAAAAKRYLTQNGIDPTRVEIWSLGEENPACTVSSDDCWSRNRRVEFEIISGEVMTAVQ